MKKLIILLTFINIEIYAVDEFFQRAMVRPTQNKIVSDFQLTFNRVNVEYEDQRLPTEDDLLEFENETLTLTPEIRYGLTDQLFLTTGFNYQFHIFKAHLEKEEEALEIDSDEKKAIHSPWLGLNFRFLESDDTFLDFEARYLFKTHDLKDATDNDLNSQFFNGANILTLRSFYGMELWDHIFTLLLEYNLLSDYKRRYALFDDTFESSSFYNIAFGLNFNYIFNPKHDLSLGVKSAVTNSFIVRSQSRTINFKENIRRQFDLTYSYRGFKSIGVLYAKFIQVFELNKFSYDNDAIELESDNTYTTFSLGITTSY